MAGEDSILTSTKAALGLLEADTSFDTELVMHINSNLSTFNQLGLGPDLGYAITGADEEWTDFLGDELRYNDAKQLLFMRVKLIFDPPGRADVVAAFEKVIEETVWRLNVSREEIIYPPVPDPEPDPEDDCF